MKIQVHSYSLQTTTGFGLGNNFEILAHNEE